MQRVPKFLGVRCFSSPLNVKHAFHNVNWVCRYGKLTYNCHDRRT
jgi:hypothetical protein